MRLIDANELEKKSIPHVRGEHGYSAKSENWAVLVKDIIDAPTIDPETMPIVQELKKQLEQVTKERDSAIKYLKVAVGETGNCYGCKWCDEKTGKCKNEIAKYECNLKTKIF